MSAPPGAHMAASGPPTIAPAFPPASPSTARLVRTARGWRTWEAVFQAKLASTVYYGLPVSHSLVRYSSVSWSITISPNPPHSVCRALRRSPTVSLGPTVYCSPAVSDSLPRLTGLPQSTSNSCGLPVWCGLPQSSASVPSPVGLPLYRVQEELSNRPRGGPGCG